MELVYDKWQEDFITTTGNKILCTGRQVGKSEICAKDAAEYAINNPTSKPIVMIAPTERQAQLLFQKTLDYLSTHYQKYIMTKKDRPTQTRIKLKINKKIVEIYCLPVGATGLGIRGFTIGRLYVDEASRLPEMVWEAVLPALATTAADMIILSTPFGAQGTFHDIWINKDGAYDDFTRISVTTEEVYKERPISATWTEVQKQKALEYIERCKRRFSKRQFMQEYLGKFVDDLHRWFSDELIEQTCTLTRPDYFIEEANYFMGVDIARMGEDKSTFQIFMRTKDSMVHVESITTEKKYTTQTEQLIIDLDKRYKFKRIYIDAGSGSLGVSIFDHLFPLFKKRLMAINNAKRIIEYNPKGEPYMVKLQKEDLYHNLRALMEQSRIRLLNDEELKYELASIQYEYVVKEGQPTKLRIFANPSADIVEGVTRGAWGVKEKINKLQILYI